jgi:ATP-dependent DNA ligase
LLTGQYDDVQRIFAFNPVEGWSRDASEDIAGALEAHIAARSIGRPAGLHRRPVGTEARPTAVPALNHAQSRLCALLTDPQNHCTGGTGWIQENKRDGYHLTVQREDTRVRLFTRNGHDWTERYPLIVEAARRIRVSAFVLDGEAVLLGGADGRSSFDGLHSRNRNDEVQFYAFDVLSSDGDLRKLPLRMRKAVWRDCLPLGWMASLYRRIRNERARRARRKRKSRRWG